MAMYNALHRGQANTGPFKCIGLMQTLKHAKQFIYIFHIKADAVVLHEQNHLISGFAGASDFDFSSRPRARKLDGIRK